MRLTSEIRNNWHQTERPTVDTSDLLTDLEGLKNISQLSSWPRATTISVSKFWYILCGWFQYLVIFPGWLGWEEGISQSHGSRGAENRDIVRFIEHQMWRQHDFSSLPYFASLGNAPSTACNRTEDASAVIEKAMLERRATSMPQVFQSFLLFFAFPESECCYMLVKSYLLAFWRLLKCLLWYETVSCTKVDSHIHIDTKQHIWYICIHTCILHTHSVYTT